MRGRAPNEAEHRSRQQRILAFVADYQSDHGYPPTRREISQELGWLSLSTLATELAQLARDGRLSVTPGVARGLAAGGGA